MKETGARIGSNGSGYEVNIIAESLGRVVKPKDASVIGGAMKSGATVITRDNRMMKFMQAAGIPFKTF